MNMSFPFDNSYARLGTGFSVRQAPVPVSAPHLIALNRPLAAELGLTLGSDDQMAQVFSGNALPEGAQPIAQAYAGHQFGGFSPQLGDGRAVLLGEVVDIKGRRRDIQLKGSGPTPFSRNGDGRAWLGPVLREYLVSEAMHAMGIPTTRALAAVSTGDAVYRQQGALPGAVLTRVAASHLRVGTFQFFAARQNLAALRQIYEYARDRHYPQAQTPGDLLRSIIQRQAALVAEWLGIGFIHGVMNTDNTSLAGETIDYGPCAFMDVWHPQTVYSSIDRHGRYAYDNQANVIVWNMAQLASALVPLMDDQDSAIDEFTQAINAMPAMIEAEWLRVFGAKIGLSAPTDEDRSLIDDLLALMQTAGVDFTNTFRNLPQSPADLAKAAGFEKWNVRWQARLSHEEDWRARMEAVNPAFIPRNHRVEEAIKAGVDGDFAPFRRLLDVLSRPYIDQPEAADLALPPQPHEVVRETFCGT
ncbi:MAG: YdiU family protein [Rhodobacterales bacterium]|nr:YdiU family protein [Rhodobacterales bacterium]